VPRFFGVFCVGFLESKHNCVGTKVTIEFADNKLMNVNPISNIDQNFHNEKKNNFIKKQSLKSDSFDNILNHYLNKEENNLTPKELLMIDGIILSDEEIILLKSLLD